MAWAEVGGGTQRATTAFSGASGTLDYPGNVTAGSILWVGGAAWDSIAPTSIAISDTLHGAWPSGQVLSAQDVGNVRYWVAYFLATSSGACTVTVDPEGNADCSFSIDEFSGSHATPLDVNDGATSGQGDNPSGSITTVADDALITGVMTHDDDAVSSPAITVGASYTQIGESENNSTNQCHSALFRIVTTPTAYTVDWTCNIAAGKESGVFLVSFKPAVVGGDTIRLRFPHALDGLGGGLVGGSRIH